MKIEAEALEHILKKVFGNEFPMKNSNFWEQMSSQTAALLEGHSPTNLPRACQFQTRTWTITKSKFSTKSGYVIGDWQPGMLHMWGTDYEEFETGPGPFPIGVIEDRTGTVHSISVDRIRMKP